MVEVVFDSDVALGYTLASRRLFCDFGRFQQWASDLVGRSLMTHEFADEDVWREICDAFELAAIPETTA